MIIINGRIRYEEEEEEEEWNVSTRVLDFSSIDRPSYFCQHHFLFERKAFIKRI